MTANLSPEQRADEEAGRVPTAPGSIASGDLVPSGNDPIALEDITALSGDRYSPNLRKWLLSRNGRFFGHAPRVFLSRDGHRWIGWIDDEMWFVGARFMRVLTSGARAETGCFSFDASSLTEEAGFWKAYIRIGRCAVDQKHDMWWAGLNTRWQTNDDTRHCLWCNAHTQHHRRWTALVERDRWEPAQAMSAGTAETEGLRAQGAARQRGPAGMRPNAAPGVHP